MTRMRCAMPSGWRSSSSERSARDSGSLPFAVLGAGDVIVCSLMRHHLRRCVGEHTLQNDRPLALNIPLGGAWTPEVGNQKQEGLLYALCGRVVRPQLLGPLFRPGGGGY